MKENLLPIRILKGVGIVLGIFLAIFVYSFMGSRVSTNDHTSPEAYGRDSLEAEAKPVMQVTVWQRNDKEAADYPGRDSYSSFFYDKIPLRLEEGETVSTNLTPVQTQDSYDFVFVDSVRGGQHIILTVTYDGALTGSYDPVRSMKYSSDLTKFPAGLPSNNNHIFLPTDGEFAIEKNLLLAFDNQTNSLLELESKNLPEDARRQLESYVLSSTGGLAYQDYTEFEKFTEVYPDADPCFSKLKRAVLTSTATIQAMHPTKPDVPVATAELELTSYSVWLLESLSWEEIDLFYESGYEQLPYSTVTVLSYTQSDAFAME